MNWTGIAAMMLNPPFVWWLVGFGIAALLVLIGSLAPKG